jgi:arylsulfatase A-like enzyme
MYSPEQMEIPRNPGADASGMPPAGVFKSGNPHTPEQWREAIAAHYACLTFIDAQVGRVLDALEESGRADRTIVVIWSDHGFMLGEHFLWRKGPLYNESTQVALLMKAPGVTKPGSVCERAVESIDIFPTLIDLCGLPQPKGIEAVSMKKLLADPAMPWKKGALMWDPGSGRSIVTQRYRYNEYPAKQKQKPELFDHETDPNEFVNLAEKPEMAEVRERLSQLLAEGWQACLPDGS